MKINQKKAIQFFLLIALVSFVLLLGQLIWSIGQQQLSARLLLLRSMILVVVAGLITFLWWLNKEADY